MAMEVGWFMEVGGSWKFGKFMEVWKIHVLFFTFGGIN